MQERQKSTVCRREQRVRRRRAPTLRKPFFCRNKPRAGLFRHSHSGQRVVIPPPHIEAPKKCKTGVFITSHSRAPAETQRSGFGGKRTSDRESESCRLRRDAGFVVRSDDGQHRICLVCGEAAALPNALGGVWPHTPKLRAEAHTHSKLRAFLRKRFYPPPAAQLQRGASPPLRNPQLSEGTRETISERSSIMKKISNSARAWRPLTVRRSGHWRRRPTCP